MAQSQQPILLLASTGLIIRNLLLGHFADEVTKHRPLIVAVPNPEDERLKEIIKGKSISLIPFIMPADPGPQTTWRKLTNWQTYMYRFRQAEKKDLRSFEIQTRLFEARHSALGGFGINCLIALGHCFRKLNLLGWIEKEYLKAISKKEVTREWRDLMEKHRPAAVVSTLLTHSLLYYFSSDLPPVLAARELSIPTGSLVQSWDNLSSKTSVLPPWLERYWVWSDAMHSELLSLNSRINASQVIKVGSPQFDFHLNDEAGESRQVWMKQAGLDPQKPYVLIGTGTSAWFPQEPKHTLKLVQSLREEMPELQFLIRFHPKDHPERWSTVREALDELGVAFQETNPKTHMDQGGFIPPKEFYRDQVNAMTHAALVINTASTLTVDAAILDRPVICIGYDLVVDEQFPEGRCRAFSRSTHYSKLTETGGVFVAGSLDACVQKAKAYLKDPSVDQSGRKKIVEVVVDQVDGKAGKRLAAQALELAA